MVDKQELDLYQLDFFLGSIFLFQTICTINSKIDSQYPFHWSYLTYGRSDSYEIAIDNYQAGTIDETKTQFLVFYHKKPSWDANQIEQVI